MSRIQLQLLFTFELPKLVRPWPDWPDRFLWPCSQLSHSGIAVITQQFPLITIWLYCNKTYHRSGKFWCKKLMYSSYFNKIKTHETFAMKFLLSNNQYHASFFYTRYLCILIIMCMRLKRALCFIVIHRRVAMWKYSELRIEYLIKKVFSKKIPCRASYRAGQSRVLTRGPLLYQ